MVGPVTLILIAAGLAMDAFAAAIAVSTRLVPLTRRHVFRLAFHLGLFQALTPLAGWTLGRSVRGLIDGWDHWVAFGLPALIGSRAVLEARARRAAVRRPRSAIRPAAGASCSCRWPRASMRWPSAWGSRCCTWISSRRSW